MQNLQLVFSKILNKRNIRIVLLQFSGKEDMIYQTREIELQTNEAMKKLKDDIYSKYMNNDKGLLANKSISYSFDNEYLSNKIYILKKDDELIKDNYVSLINSINNVDVESDPLNFKKGYVLEYRVENKYVFLISISPPHKTLKRAFALSDRKYKPINDRYLYLRDEFDLIAYDDNIYVFNDKVEQLFNLERSYKIKSERICNLIEDKGIVENNNDLKEIIKSNKRLSVKFNEETYNLIRNSKVKRKEVAKELNLTVNKDGLIKIKSKEEAKKIYELLCNKAMKNIVDDNMYRVSNAEKI